LIVILGLRIGEWVSIDWWGILALIWIVDRSNFMYLWCSTIVVKYLRSCLALVL
jgi:hypothetical protein